MIYWRILIVTILTVTALQAAAAQKGAPAAQKSAPEVVWSDEDTESNELGSKLIIGMVEKVIVEPGNVTLDARIDTGANMTSIGAPQLQVVNEDGQDWALYVIDGKQIRSKVVKYVLIKQHGAASQRRPVIMLQITMGKVTQAVMATLTDRSNFKYKILIGVNYLKDHFIVDVSRKHVLKPVPTP